MSELGEARSPLDAELANIDSPVDRAAFEYFYNMSDKEGPMVAPNYVWDQFHEGVAEFSGMPWEDVNTFLKMSGLHQCQSKCQSPPAPLLSCLLYAGAYQG